MKNNQEQVTILDRIWDAAKRNPSKIIIYDNEKNWTWQSLLWLAQSYAKALQKKYSSLDDLAIVPILVGRSGETVAAILGVLISGRGFAPINPKQPAVRLKHCFKSLNADAYISTSGELNNLAANEETKHYKQITPSSCDDETDIPTKPAKPDSSNILYILFTSGSTGVPKGVVAEYGNIENTMLWSMDMLDWQPNDVIGCCTNFFFDISMFDIFTTFYFDIPLAIYSKPSDVSQVVSETNIFHVTSIFGVPTFFSQILQSGLINDSRLSTLRRIIAGGDFFHPKHILGWIENLPNVEIYNVWGPTETSIVNTMYKISSVDLSTLQDGCSVPVGKAHPRMQFSLLDESGKIVDDSNVKGEICMLGACVTREYLGDSQKTRNAYINVNGQRAFRTQDIGYLDQSDNLFIVGRMGATVKISGYRIDLGEVETAAASLAEIYLACSFVIEVNEGHKELWLAVELKDRDTDLDIFSIKKRLRSKLTAYMVPKRVLVMDELPKNANGKILRSAVAQKAYS